MPTPETRGHLDAATNVGDPRSPARAQRDLASPGNAGAEVSGSFDDSSNRVTIVLPNSLVPETDPPRQPVTSGSLLSDLEVLGQRDPGAVVVLVADTATGTCTYTAP